MKVPSTGRKGASHPPGVARTQTPGGPQSSLKILFQTNRPWQRGWNWSWDLGTLKNTVFSPFWVPKKVQKISHFLRTQYFQLFQALAPIPSSSPCPKHIPQCPGQFLGSSGSLVLNVFFLRQKIHFRKMCMISWFSAVSGLGSITSVFSGSR